MIFWIKFTAIAFAFFSFVAFASLPARAQAEQNSRIALVIGNSAYPDHPLAAAANDAGLIAQTLQAAGFDVVGARDLDGNSLRSALRAFLDKAATAGPDMQAFVYLAGRGVQYDGDNYFAPVDARIAHDTDVPIEAIKIADFSRALAAVPGRARILVLDAARANSFVRSGPPLAGGLALVDAEAGSLIAFNAAPGTIAPDEPGPYGVYAKALAGAMRQGGLPIDDVFAQARLLVNQQTNGAVVPWTASKVNEPYVIFERAPDAPPLPAIAALSADAQRPLSSFGPDEAYAVALERDTLSVYGEYLIAFPDSPQARRVRAILAARREALFWRRSVAENSPRAYWTYLRFYPRGPHVADARRRLDILAAQFAPPPDFAPFEYADLPPPPPAEIVYLTGPTIVFEGPNYGPPPPRPPRDFLFQEDERWRDLPPPAPSAGVGFLPVLAVGIPLLAGARAFHHKGEEAHERDRRPGAPPPLPPGFRPRGAAPIVPAAPAVQPPAPPNPLPGAPGGPSALKPPAGAIKPLPGAPGSELPDARRPPVESEPLAKPAPQKFRQAPQNRPAPPAERLAPPVREPAAAPPTPRLAPERQQREAPERQAPERLQREAPERLPREAPGGRAEPGKRPACGEPHTPPCPR